MKNHVHTWRIIANSGAITWRALAEHAKSDPKLAELMTKVADAMKLVEEYLTEKMEMG